MRLVLVLLVVGGAAAAQDFEPFGGPLPSVAPSVSPRAGVSFACSSGVVVFDCRGVRGTAGATAPTGAVHELAVLPWGTVVAACERGLFVCDEQHPVLDAADLRDGGPPADVRSVAADARGRVWWCSADAFGVVDLRLRCGRRFGAGDGLPPAPFARVAAVSGRVLLATANGVFAYTPDRGPEPRLRAGPDAGAPLCGSAAGEAALACEVDARGGASLRVRRRHHHLLVPLDDGRVTGLRPGRHVLEVHALDRDLRCAVVGEYAVDVPLPERFDQRLVLGVGGALFVLLWWSAARARGGGAGASAAAAALRSAVFAVVALQVLAAVLGYGRGWPFVAFSMYTETWRENDVLFRPRIAGVCADGTRVQIAEQAVGLNQDGYWQMLAEVAFGGDDVARAFFASVARCRGPGDPPFTGFTLADGRIRLTANGPVDVAPTVLVAWSER